jgi:hypothetical protein
MALGHIFGKRVKRGDHFHVEWRCPDCGAHAYVSADHEHPIDAKCGRTGRYYRVVPQATYVSHQPILRMVESILIERSAKSIRPPRK